jgi:membrane fusion protein (multidrug efflux system)
VVLTGEARLETVTDSIEALGTVRAREAVAITANVTAKVEKVGFDDNDRVERGAVLVELDDAIPLANLREAEVVMREDQRLLAHYQALDKRNAVSRTVLDEQRAKAAASEARVAAARAELAEYTIRAPFDGVLGTRQVSPGSLVSPGTVITTLDAIDTLRVDFTVPERWLSDLEPGQTIRATSVAYPDRVFEGKVASVGSRVDPVTRAVAIHARMENPELLLKPGMLLSIELVGRARPALLVSEKALVLEGAERYVYRVNGDNTVARQKVSTGRRLPGQVEIRAGLEPGDRVVVEGTQKVRDGTVVQLAPAPETGA